jgi:hypothetical protein
VDNIYRAGKDTGGFVRASIKVERAQGSPNVSDDGSEDSEFSDEDLAADQD